MEITAAKDEEIRKYIAEHPDKFYSKKELEDLIKKYEGSQQRSHQIFTHYIKLRLSQLLKEQREMRELSRRKKL